MARNTATIAQPADQMPFSARHSRFVDVVVRAIMGGIASVPADEKTEVLNWFRGEQARALPPGIARPGTFDLKRLRRRAGLTQQQLAERVGCSERSVRLWEKRRTIPRLEVARAVAHVFGLDERDVVRMAGSRLAGGGARQRVCAEGVAFDLEKPLVRANLRAGRVQAGLSQAALAAQVGVSRVMLSRYEVGALFPAMRYPEWRRRVLAALCPSRPVK